MKGFHFLLDYFSFKKSNAYLVIFIISFLVFGFLHFDKTFADPESFYHVKATQILAEQGAITSFPWLSSTFLSHSFTDHHFLYHLILIPFVYVFPPLLGIKVATVFFASFFIVFFFWFLEKLNVKGAFWYALFLLTINPFVFRIGLAKAQGMVLLFLLVIVYLIFSRKYIFLILASCFYVWLYAGWPLAIFLAGLYGALTLIWPDKKSIWGLLTFKKNKPWKQAFFLVASGVIGALAGIFFSPYFPGNLQFYYQQTFKIALVNYQNLIGVGGEWYPYAPGDLFLAAVPFFILLIFALGAFIYSYKNQKINSWFFLIVSFLFFILTLKSRRYVEYLVPFGVIFSALSLRNFWQLYQEFFKKHFSKNFVSVLPLILFLVISPFIINDLGAVKRSYAQGLSFDRFLEPATWLMENSEPGDIVFHSDWDEFPILFYHNSSNYYLVGLDPTFMYNYSSSLHQSWVDITQGKNADVMYKTIRDVFNAKYVFVDYLQNPSFDKNLEDNFYMEKVFENNEARIYQVN